MTRLFAAAAVGCLLLTCLSADPAHACTAFCMDTLAGPVYGANCDLFIPGDGLVFVNRRGIAKESMRAGTTGQELSWTSAYGSVTFNLAGRGFAWGGMNEAGLVVTTLELQASELPEPDERTPFDSGSLNQYLLDTCGSVQEAVRTMKSVRLIDDGDSRSHLLLADASGAGAALEYLDGELVVYTGEDLPVTIMSNMRYERALTAYDRGGPRWWWSNPGQSAERFAGCAVRMEEFDAARDTCAVTHAFGTLARVEAPHSRWSIVYDLAGRKVWFRTEANPEVRYLSLDAFDLACDAPLMMLDVNIDREGQVADLFTPYDHDVNLTVFRTFCARWGIDVPAEGAAELMGFFEGFTCAAE